eukprot:5638583-Pyramimonas_sp.AAC.1
MYKHDDIGFRVRAFANGFEMPYSNVGLFVVSLLLLGPLAREGSLVSARDLYLPSLVSNSGNSPVVTETKMSSGISKGLVQRVAINRAIIVTWANAHYVDFARNFARHMRELGLTNFVIGAMDEQLHEILVKEGVNTWFMGSKGIDQNTVKNDFGWGSPKFHQMGRW